MELKNKARDMTGGKLVCIQTCESTEKRLHDLSTDHQEFLSINENSNGKPH